MPPPRKHWVKLKVPKEFLEKIPRFTLPPPKTRVRKVAAEKKNGSDSNSNSKTSSPQPEMNYRINSGLKETSTSGLTMNSISGTYTLDKSGKPVNKFVKRPRQFKTFSGFKVKYVTWKVKKEREKKEKKEDKKEVKEVKEDVKNLVIKEEPEVTA
ncbi:hypothetical protein CLIB1444_01S04192 [[Candida] jaroonii]|uniref:Uncharacterized protein n=1 Tax=[Candida] jaroonii TaxID=467808 RepID=A0ACA9Y078_9ASCO|nr:hypothetical protein CLIB1444_01S04192 [[Candida] jaroonii]